MANENNNVPLTVPEIVEDQAQPVQGPSTPEAQEETQQALQEKQNQMDAFNRTKSEIVSRSLRGIKPGGVSDTEVLDEMDRQDELRAQEEQERQNEIALQQEELEQRLEARRNDLQRAAARNIELPRNEELDSMLEAREQEADAIQTQQEEQAQAVQDRVELAATPVEKEIEIETAPIRQQVANQIAEDKRTAAKQREEEEIQQLSNNKLKELDSRMEELRKSELDPQRFWNNMPLGQKILAGLSIFLGGIGAGLTKQPNRALDMIQEAIDKDLDAQKQQRKMNIDEVAAKRAEYFKMMDQKLDEMRAKTSSDLAKANIANIKDQIAKRSLQAEADKQAAVQKLMRRQYLEQTGEVPPELLSEEDRKNAQSLRKEYNQQTKDLGTNEIINQYRQVKNFSQNPSPAGDIGLVFSYMKILDPRSVVREGEFATASNAGGVSDKLRNIYNKSIEGTRLTEKQRQDFASQASKIMQAKLKTQSNINDRYRKLAKRSNVPVNLVVEKFDINDIEPNESNIQTLVKKKGLSREQAVKVLKKTNRWFGE